MRFEEILNALEEGLAFCESVGLGHPARQGRFGTYSRWIRQLLEVLPRLGSLSENERQRVDRDSVRYQVALFEGVEACDIFEYLRREKPAGFESRLEIVLGGPELPSDENETSNRARNVQFELLMARDLAAVGFPPQLAEPDLRAKVLEHRFHFACKRVFAEGKLQTRLLEAGHQLRRSLRDDPGTASGIVAISLARVLNPDANAVRARDLRQAAMALNQWLTEASERVQPAVQALFDRGDVVLVHFYAAGDIHNLAIGRLERAAYVLGRPKPNLQPFSSCGRALKELTSRLGGLKTIDSAATKDSRSID